MKRIILSTIIAITICSTLQAQRIGLALFAAPSFTKVKYNDFNTFAESYNAVNGFDLQGFTKMKANFSYGGDIYVGPIYWGLYYNRFKELTTPVKIDAYCERQFNLRLHSIIANIGGNIGEGPFIISPYVACGWTSLFLDAYMNYFDGDRRYYGNYKLDGTYRGNHMSIGFGLKTTYLLKPFYVSLGFTKLYSAWVGPFIHDFGEKGNPVLGGGYTELGTDWATFTSNGSYNYKGEYMTSSVKQFTIQLSAGIFLGNPEN